MKAVTALAASAPADTTDRDVRLAREHLQRQDLQLIASRSGPFSSSALRTPESPCVRLSTAQISRMNGALADSRWCSNMRWMLGSQCSLSAPVQLETSEIAVDGTERTDVRVPVPWRKSSVKPSLGAPSTQYRRATILIGTPRTKRGLFSTISCVCIAVYRPNEREGNRVREKVALLLKVSGMHI